MTTTVADYLLQRLRETVPDIGYAAFARSLGLGGINVEKPDGVGPTWETALAADHPTVLDIRCDPDVSKQGIKQKVQQYLPGTKDEDQ